MSERISDAELTDCIEVARQDMERLAANAHGRTRIHSNIHEALRELQQHRSGPDARDGARYRWLRNDSKFAGPRYRYGEMVWPVIGVDANQCEPCFGAELDAAIDSALAGP